MNTSNSPILSLAVAASAVFMVAGSRADIVSTAFGNGADIEMQERGIDTNFTESAVNDVSMNTRTSSGGDRNEVVGLRFDLTGYTKADLTGVSLSLYNYRNNNSAREIALYGVAQGTVSGSGAFTTETWSDTTLAVFGDLPGLLATDGDALTQSLNAGSLTPLGALAPINNTSEGTVVTFNDAALTAYLQGFSGSDYVTFIVAANPGYDSSGQWRGASREAASLNSIVGVAGEFAPYLEFTLIPEPTSLALLGLGGLALWVRRRI